MGDPAEAVGRVVPVLRQAFAGDVCDLAAGLRRHGRSRWCARWPGRRASDNYWLDGMLLSHMDAKQVDALAIAPYMSS